MENNLPLWEFIRQLTVFDVVKWFLVAGLVLYTAFAVVIIRQVGVMSEAVKEDINALVALFAWAHLALSILLLIMAIVIL